VGTQHFRVNKMNRRLRLNTKSYFLGVQNFFLLPYFATLIYFTSFHICYVQLRRMRTSRSAAAMRQILFTSLPRPSSSAPSSILLPTSMPRLQVGFAAPSRTMADGPPSLLVRDQHPLSNPAPDGPSPRKGHAAGGPGDTPIDITFGDVATAAHRIKHSVPQTVVHRSRRMSALLGANVYFKNEYELPTGSFKERGARNAMLLLEPDQKKRGVVAASAGNHALALAYHGQQLGIPVTVVMPRIAPITKVQNCRDLGATVLVQGAHIGEAREAAAQLGEERGYTYINGFDHPAIIAGAGTMGMEIIEQVPDVDAVIIPVGGAGLIAGSALAIKTLKPDAKVYGAEPLNCPSLTAALEQGRPVTVSATSTLADGLLVPRVGTNAFALAQKHVEKVVCVREKFIALAMLRLVEMEKCVIEGGGATGLAAMLQGLLPELQGKTVVIPLCGGNVDTPVLGRVLERGLAADGRLVRFEAVVSDRPGGIAALTRVIADAGASIKDIYHERAWVDSDIASVRVKCVVECADRAAALSMFEALETKGYVVDANAAASVNGGVTPATAAASASKT
jgi:threonine dehydratase